MKPERIKHQAVSVAFAVALFAGAVERLDGGAVIGATEPTQILNNIQLVAQYAKQAQMVLQQAQMIQNQLNSYQVELQNVEKLNGLDWQNATRTINALANNFLQGVNVAYQAQQQDAAFVQFHQTYAQYAAQPPGSPTPATYQQWIQYNNDAANRAANAAGLTIQQASTEQARIAALKAAGQSSNGQLQALTAANALSAEVLDQLRTLNRMIAQQMDTEARYHRVEEEKKTQAVAGTANINATTVNAADAKTAPKYGAPGTN